jgi:hypothetical protein
MRQKPVTQFSTKISDLRFSQVTIQNTIFWKVLLCIGFRQIYCPYLPASQTKSHKKILHCLLALIPDPEV